LSFIIDGMLTRKRQFIPGTGDFLNVTEGEQFEFILPGYIKFIASPYHPSIKGKIYQHESIAILFYAKIFFCILNNY